MQLLLDFFPLIAFFIAYRLFDIFVATGVIIIAVLIQTAIQWQRQRKLNAMAIVSAVLVVVFGGITLLLRDKAFIQWKVTVTYWLAAIAFAVSHFIGDRPLLQRTFAEPVRLERRQWLNLSWAWIIFFTLLGVLNLYVAFNFSEEIWVKFKVFGSFGLLLLAVVVQVYWFSRQPGALASQEDRG